MIHLELELDKKFIPWMRRQPKAVTRGIKKGLRKSMLRIEADAKRNFNKVLNVRTGRLRNSIFTKTTEQHEEHIGIIGAGSLNVKYAAVHEFGLRHPRAKRMNLFMPKRPFISPAIEKNNKRIEQDITDGINKELNKEI
jgi:phage gpG-like protein